MTRTERLCAIVALTCIPAFSRAAGTTSPALGPSVGEIGYSGLISLEFPPSGYDVGPRVTAEGMYGFNDLTPEARLSLGGRAAFGYHGGSGFNGSLWLLEAVPDAKVAYALTDLLAVYGDLGAGLALIETSVNVPAAAGFPGASVSDTSLALTFQVGAGASYTINPHINVLGEVRFDFYTKSGAGTFITFPSVGLQWH